VSGEIATHSSHSSHKNKKMKFNDILNKILASSERLIAVDAGSRTVKIVEFRKNKDGFEPVLFDAEPVSFVSERGDITPEQIRRTLEIVLNRNGVKNGAIISILPYEFAIMKRFKVPSVSREQIKKIVPFESEKFLPFSLDRGVLDFDFRPIDDETLPESLPEKNEDGQPQAPGKKSMVTIVAARKAFIPKFLNLFKIKGCKQKAIDVSSFALYNSVSYFFKKNPPDAKADDIVVIDIGARRTELILVSAKNDELLFARNVKVGGDILNEYIVSKENVSFEQAEKNKCENWEKTVLNDKNSFDEAISPLIDNLNKTIKFILASKTSEKIGQIWLTGGGADIPGIVEFIQEKFGIEVSKFDTAKLVGAKNVTTSPSIFGFAVGAALRIVGEAKTTIDILPVDIAKLQLQALRQRRLIQLGIAVGFIAVLSAFIFGVNVLWTSIQVNTLRNKFIKLSPYIQHAESLEKRNAQLKDAVENMVELTDRKTSWSQVFQTISGYTDSNIWITSLSVNKKNRLTINAQCLGTTYIDFKNKLMNSLRFQDLIVGAVTKKDQRVGREIIPIRIFKLDCDVLPDYKYQELLSDLKKRLMSKRSDFAYATKSKSLAKTNNVENVNTNSLIRQPSKMP